MNSNEIALGILKAVMALAVGYVTYRFFSDYPLLLIPVAVVGIVSLMVKEVGIVRTAVWLITMGGFVIFGWGLYSNFYDGKSVEAGIAVMSGPVVLLVGDAVSDWLRKRDLTARSRVS